MSTKAETHSTRRPLTRVLGAVIALLLGLSGAVITSTAAEAAQQGYGQYRSGFWHGSYYEPGSGYIYCLDSDRSEPVGVNTTNTGAQTFIPAAGGVSNLSGNILAGINWLVSTYGQTTDNATARAVNDGIWIATQGYSTSDPLSNQFASQILSYVAPPNGGTGSVTMTFQVDRANNYLGTLTIAGMTRSPASGTITLTNGVFRDTGLTTRVGSFSTGQVFQITGVPPTQNGAPYKIGASANLQATLPSGYAAQVTIWTTGNYQRLAGPGGMNNAVMNLSGTALDPTLRATEFLPVATTQVVSESLAVGETFKDVLTFGLGADDNGTVNQWPKATNGDYLPVFAKGTVYGPFIDRPIQSPTVPAGAPVAGHFSVTTTAVGGPTIPYPVESDQPVVEAGYYVAVVEINWAEQSPSNPPTQGFIPSDYNFQDDFGQLVETSIVPFSIQYLTQLSTNVVTIGDELTDRITPSLVDGAWLRDGGTRVPVTVTGTWYYSSTQPVQAGSAPTGAEVIGTQTATLTGPNLLTETDPMKMPYKQGWVTVQWCATASIYVNGYCDDYGVPAETAQLVGPSVTTTAQPTAVPSDTVSDVAHVTGPVPAEGMLLYFTGYLQPDQTGGPSFPDCGEGTEIYISSAPVLVTGPGDYQSEIFDVLPEHVGTVHWGHVLRSLGGDSVDISPCGAPNETTEIAWPSVTTAAVPGGSVGGEIYDVATVTGLIPTAGLSLYFTGYLQPEGATVPDCSDPILTRGGTSTKVFESTRPMVVSAPGDYQSEGFPVTSSTLGTIYWVETLELNPNPAGVTWTHVGECGLANETTRIVDVTTEAVDAVTLGQPAHDTALVDGDIPDEATTGIRAELTFAAYRQTGTVPVCTPAQRVFTTEDSPLIITGPGTYESAPTTFATAGTYYWVETVTFRDVATDTVTEVHVGECGLPAETTVVNTPPLAFTGGVVDVTRWVLAVALVLIGLVLVVFRRQRRMTTLTGE